MARPTKQGLDYFPVDVDMDTADDRIYVMEADHGVEGFGILIKLLMNIYQQNGYYMKWDENATKVFCKKKNININSFINVVNSCINLGFFSKQLFDEYGVLTSRGVQKRFFEGSKKRKNVNFIREFLLLDLRHEVSSGINVVYSSINEVNSGINGVNSCKKYTKDSTVNKRKGYSAEAETIVNSSGKELNAAPPSASPPAQPSEVISPPLKTTPKTKPKHQQLAEAAELLRVEDPEGYKEFIAIHPELVTKEVPW